MLIENDPLHAFLPYPAVPVSNATGGPLAGLTLAVKDLFDVAGYRTGCGSPLKLAASAIKDRNAPAVQALLDAGARFVGKTHTDELAWSLYGMNPHFGTPVNPAAPGRIPGGSSSGSASAVAGGLADIALGTDTGGSIRAPASFCGIWGLRPTHGRISLSGCMELAASLDTCGFFARDAETLANVGTVLMGPDAAPLPDAPRFLQPIDMIEPLPAASRALYDSVFSDLSTAMVSVYPEGGADALYQAFRIVQTCDIKRSQLDFILESGMPLARGLDDRVAFAQAVTEEQENEAISLREDFRTAIDALLGSDGVLLAPAVHDAPFRLDAPASVFDSYRHDAMRLLSVAGMAGLPQVTFPAGLIEGAPFGLSLIGPRGSDLSLMTIAARLFADRHKTD
ncbi:amidase [Rhizobium sp. NRK18]|nr:amidase [Rhizobium sp. NRK18]